MRSNGPHYKWSLTGVTINVWALAQHMQIRIFDEVKRSRPFKFLQLMDELSQIISPMDSVSNLQVRRIRR